MEADAIKQKYDLVSEENEIMISHFINPNKFYFVYKLEAQKRRNRIITLEKDMMRYFNQTQPDVRYEPEKNKMFAFFDKSNNRYIRVLIDDIRYCNNKNVHLMWAIDYGFPLQTKERNYIKDLPERFVQYDIGVPFHEGVFNVLPAKKAFNLVKNKQEIVPASEWNGTAIERYETILFDSAEIKFIQKKFDNGKIIGDALLKRHDGMISSFCQLVHRDCGGVIVDNMDKFLTGYNKTNTRYIERWNDNAGAGGVLKNDLKVPPNTPKPKYYGDEEDIEYSRSKVEGWKTDFSSGSNDENSMPKLRPNTSNQSQQNVAEATENPNYIPNTIKPMEPPRKLGTSTSHFSIFRKMKTKEQPQKPADNGQRSQASFNSRNFDTSTQLSVIAALKMKNEERRKIHENMEPKTNAVEEKYPIFPAGKVIDENMLKQVKNTNQKKSNQSVESFSSSGESGSPKKSNVQQENSVPKRSGPKSLLKTLGKIQQAKSSKSSSSSECGESSNAFESVFKNLSKTDGINAENNNLRLIPAGGNYDDKFVRPTVENFGAKPKIFNSQRTEQVSLSFINNNQQDQKPTTKTNIRKKLDDEACIVDTRDLKRVFIHGSCAKPVETIAEVNFSRIVHEYFKRIRFRVPFKIQQYCWPNMMANNSFVVIGHRNGHKTYSYLPAICSIYDGIDESNHKVGTGPEVVIIVKSSRDCEMLSKQIKRDLTNNNLSIVMAYGFQKMEEIMCELLNGCHFFITTPACFVRLSSNPVQFFSKSRIEHLIIDDYDSLIKHFKKEIDTILLTCCKPDKPEDNPQIVITSNVWFSSLKTIMNTYAILPAFIFGNYVEAAVYANTNFTLKIFENDQYKIKEILNFVKDERCLHEKTIIFTVNDEETEKVCAALRENNHSYKRIDYNSYKIKGKIEELLDWDKSTNKGHFEIIVGADTWLRTIKLSRAQHLIHFSLPETFDMFSERFACSLEFFSKECIPFNLQPNSLIMLDEKNNVELPRLIEFWKLHQATELPDALEVLVQKALIRKERDLTAVVCPNIYEFGHCINHIGCKHYRHAFRTEDKHVQNLPTSGAIKFEILQVYSLKHFVIKILKYFPNGGDKWESFQAANSTELLLKMGNYFATAENRIELTQVVPGEVCVYIEKDMVKRCQIMSTSKIERVKNYVFAIVRLIDNGETIQVMSNCLYNLPNEFKSFPAIATDLYITDLVPSDFDENWESHSITHLKNLLKSYSQEKDIYLSCNIQFVISDKIYTNTVKVYHTLKGISSNVLKENIRQYLLDKQYCLSDASTTQRLKDLAYACDVLGDATTEPVPVSSMENGCEISNTTSSIDTDLNGNSTSFSESPEKKSEKEKSKTAENVPKSIKSPKRNLDKWMELKIQQCYQVFICYYSNPDEIFLQIIDPDDRWAELDDELNNLEVAEHLQNIEPGANCLLLNGDGYIRAKILSINNDDTVTCFTVDNGTKDDYSREDIFEIPEHLLNMISFQVISCKLTGIAPKKGKYWTDEELLAVENYVANKDETMAIRVTSKMENFSDEMIAYNSYEILLASESDIGNNININRKLIDEGIVAKDPWTHELLDAKIELVGDDNNVAEPLQIDFENLEMELDENILDFCNGLGYNIDPKILELLKKPQPELENNESKIDSAEAQAEQTEVLNNDSNKFLLEYVFNFPQVEWQQSESVIKLKVSAFDCLDYSFDLNEQYLILILKFENSYKCALINFFGAIHPAQTSHELRGIYIIIRLVKALKSKLKWPRLLSKKSRENWLKWNMIDIDFYDDIEMRVPEAIDYDRLSEHEDDDESEPDSDVVYETNYDPNADDFND